MDSGRRLAVIGGGWAGLAAAVEATGRGDRVVLFEMARSLGGRARDVDVGGQVLDNGQHLCIGAYSETLRLLRTVGVAESDAFLRLPLRLHYPDQQGLALGAGPPALAFALAVLRHPGWHWRDKAALLKAAAQWLATGFRSDPRQTVAELSTALPAAVRADLIEPLCVAALNTPAATASAAVFLRILQDALFSGRGSADFLLPRTGLGDIFPAPAARWLAKAGAEIRLGRRVQALLACGAAWHVDDERFDGIVVAASPAESARLVGPIATDWADAALKLAYEPIVTVYLQSPGTRLPEPVLALRADAQAPAQFVFDRGQLGGPPGLLAFVISGAGRWVEAGTDATLVATHRQAASALHGWLRAPARTVQVVTEKRATFACTPQLVRPAMRIAPHLCAAGDYIRGPYPATLEGAVRAGVAAASAWRD